MTKEHILAEIRRTAHENGGAPLGVKRFVAETGIRPHAWSGRYWARWNDALEEAGFASRGWKKPRTPEDEVFAKLAAEVVRLGRMPTESELILRRQSDDAFPSVKVFRRFGAKTDLTRKLAEYCRSHGLENVPELIALPAEAKASSSGALNDSEPVGFVYMIKSGRFYKIGSTNDVGRRSYELGIQLPEPTRRVHMIATDDPVGIERYWHERFANSRKNGEWFALTKADIAAFKKRKFM